MRMAKVASLSTRIWSAITSVELCYVSSLHDPAPAKLQGHFSNRQMWGFQSSKLFQCQKNELEKHRQNCPTFLKQNCKSGSAQDLVPQQSTPTSLWWKFACKQMTSYITEQHQLKSRISTEDWTRLHPHKINPTHDMARICSAIPKYPQKASTNDYKTR